MKILVEYINHLYGSSKTFCTTFVFPSNASIWIVTDAVCLNEMNHKFYHLYIISSCTYWQTKDTSVLCLSHLESHYCKSIIYILGKMIHNSLILQCGFNRSNRRYHKTYIKQQNYTLVTFHNPYNHGFKKLNNL